MAAIPPEAQWDLKVEEVFLVMQVKIAHAGQVYLKVQRGLLKNQCLLYSQSSKAKTTILLSSIRRNLISRLFPSLMLKALDWPGRIEMMLFNKIYRDWIQSAELASLRHKETVQIRLDKFSSRMVVTLISTMKTLKLQRRRFSLKYIVRPWMSIIASKSLSTTIPNLTVKSLQMKERLWSKSALGSINYNLTTSWLSLIWLPRAVVFISTLYRCQLIRLKEIWTKITAPDTSKNSNRL